MEVFEEKYQMLLSTEPPGEHLNHITPRLESSLESLCTRKKENSATQREKKTTFILKGLGVVNGVVSVCSISMLPHESGLC